MTQALIDIVSRWYSTGHISPDEKAILKAEYLLQLDYKPGCTICDSFWSDVKHHFWYNLKTLNLLPVKTTIRKHIILGSGMLMLPGSSTVIVNEGEETEDRELLTDDKAAEILAKYPSYSTLIGINPAWQAREDILAQEAESGSDSTESDDESSDQSTPYSQLQAKYETLLADNEKLKHDHEQLKNDHSVTKGMLTRAKNQLAKQPETPAPAASAPAPVNTLPAAEATNGAATPTPSDDLTNDAPTGAGGDNSSADTGTSASSTDLASSTQETIDQSQA